MIVGNIMKHLLIRHTEIEAAVLKLASWLTMMGSTFYESA